MEMHELLFCVFSDPCLKNMQFMYTVYYIYLFIKAAAALLILFWDFVLLYFGRWERY